MELDVHTSEARRGLINSVQSGCLTKPLSVRRFNLTSGCSAVGSRRTLYYTVYISIQIAGKKNQTLALAPPPRLGLLMNLFCYFRKSITARLD